MEPLPIDAPAIINDLLRRTLEPQHVLAQRAGISPQALSAYLTGRRRPKLDVLQKIAAAGRMQLRVSLEPLAHDVITGVDALHELPPNQWIEESSLNTLYRAQTLVNGVAHRFEGAIAARAQGVPVNCPSVEVTVRDDHTTLERLVANARAGRIQLCEVKSQWMGLPDGIADVRDCQIDDVVLWGVRAFGEVRMRLSAEVGNVLVLRRDDNDLAVAPLGELVIHDARARRTLDVARELRRRQAVRDA